MFTLTQNRLKIDDVLGVWPLHGLCGAWGGIACGIFGAKALGGMGGVSFMSQLIGTRLGIVVALIGGAIVYGVLKATVGIRLDAGAGVQRLRLEHAPHHRDARARKRDGDRERMRRCIGRDV